MAEKTVEVKRRRYRRTIKAREVTFVCKCHPGGPTEVTEERMPSPLPTHCMACDIDGTYQKYHAAKALKWYHDNKFNRTS